MTKEKDKNPVGRPLNVKTPEEMLQHFDKYVAWCIDNPVKKHDVRGKDPVDVYIEIERPLTMSGFYTWCYKNDIGSVEDYFVSPEERYSKFSSICSRIKDEVRQSQIVGGMAGIFNPSITQRLNGLVDKQQNEVKGNATIVIKKNYTKE